MRVWTSTELFRLTRAELLRLDYEMATAHRESADPGLRDIALDNLHRIRRELGLRELDAI